MQSQRQKYHDGKSYQKDKLYKLCLLQDTCIDIEGWDMIYGN